MDPPTHLRCHHVLRRRRPTPRAGDAWTAARAGWASPWPPSRRVGPGKRPRGSSTPCLRAGFLTVGRSSQILQTPEARDMQIYPLTWPAGGAPEDQIDREALGICIAMATAASLVDLSPGSVTLRNDSASALSALRKGCTGSPFLQKCVMRLHRFRRCAGRRSVASARPWRDSGRGGPRRCLTVAGGGGAWTRLRPGASGPRTRGSAAPSLVSLG